MAKPILTRNTTLLKAPSKTDIVPSILLLLASRGAVLGTFPFGTAFFAACFDKNTAYLGITVLYLGLISAGASAMAVKYMMASLIFWLFINLYRKGQRPIEGAVCGLSVFISGMAAMFYTFSGVYDVFLLFIESVISGIMYVIFSGTREVIQTKRKTKSQEELLSLGAAAGVFILGLGKTALPFNISVANIITIYTVLIAALNSNISGAALMGLILGFITGGKDAIIMMGAFGISAVFAGFLKSLGRFGAAAGFLGGACAVLLYAGTNLPYSVNDVLIATALFAATPKLIQQKFSVFIGEGIVIEESRKSDRIRAYMSEKLEEYSDAFQLLSKEVLSVSSECGNSTEPMEIFSETASRICSDCPKCQKCWDKDSDKTIDGMTDLLCILEEKGELTLSAMPLSFRDRCMRAERMVYELAHSYELFKMKRARDDERIIEREAAALQYDELSDLLLDLSKDIMVDFCSDAEESVIFAFDCIGTKIYEISIAEGEGTEVYLRADDNIDVNEAEQILTDTLGINIGFEKSDGDGLYFTACPKYKVEVGVKQISKEESCGDTVRVFGTKQYKLYCILCDGMGVGEKAANGSGTAASLLQSFLEVGFSIKSAIKLVNYSMCINSEDDFFTTLDLLCIDLMKGTAEFYKMSAVQSMIYRQGVAETVFSAALPIGFKPLTEIIPQENTIGDGDVILMASDGITESGEIKTEWLKKSIKTPFVSMQSMAEELAAHALKRNNGHIKDDMSVITLKITEE